MTPLHEAFEASEHTLRSLAKLLRTSEQRVSHGLRHPETFTVAERNDLTGLLGKPEAELFETKKGENV